MAENGLYAPWTFQVPLPEELQKVSDKTSGKRFSVKSEDCSKYNILTERKMAKLHAGTLYGMIRLWKILKEGQGAVGIQTAEGQEVNYYCMEYEQKEERIGILYQPRTGWFQGIRKQGTKSVSLSPVEQGKDIGEAQFAVLAYACSLKDTPLYDEEFADDFDVFQEQMNQQITEPEKMMHVMCRCCDHIYRRIENALSIEKGGIPMNIEQFDYEGKKLTSFFAQSAMYAPNQYIHGKFQLLGKREEKVARSIENMKRFYIPPTNLSERERKKIPTLPEEYLVSAETQEILDMVTKTPARIVMVTGEAGVGKTTDSQIIAQVLGRPYFAFTCSPDTDEITLVAGMLPNTGRNPKANINWPSFEDLMMDPASAVARMTGCYPEGITSEEALREMMEAAYKNGYEQAKEEREFVMVESAIVQACRCPSVIEIQEPTMIERPGILTKLNALLDDSAAIELINGERVTRHPDTIVIFTTNLDYIGCQMFNESVLSRMDYVQHRGGLTEKQMVKRIMQRTPCREEALLCAMAEIISKIQGYMKKEEIRGGVCGYRELENWVWNYMITGNVIKAAMDTVVSKASLIQEDRKEIENAFLLPYFRTYQEEEAA